MEDIKLKKPVDYSVYLFCETIHLEMSDLRKNRDRHDADGLAIRMIFPGLPPRCRVFILDSRSHRLQEEKSGDGKGESWRRTGVDTCTASASTSASTALTARWLRENGETIDIVE